MESEDPVVVTLSLKDQQHLRERMHKLRNILGTISAFGELMGLENLSDKGKERSRKLVIGVMEARDVIEEIHGILVPKKS